MYKSNIFHLKEEQTPQIKNFLNTNNKGIPGLKSSDSALSHPHTNIKRCSNLIKKGYVKMASNLWKNETQL